MEKTIMDGQNVNKLKIYNIQIIRKDKKEKNYSIQTLVACYVTRYFKEDFYTKRCVCV